MSNFKEYRRKNVAEMRDVNSSDCHTYHELKRELYNEYEVIISISKEDKANGSPKIGDMIARNPVNPRDQWLVAEAYVIENFELDS